MHSRGADAGIYVPTIAREIVRQPDGLNLKGFAVGDGCIGSDVNCGGGSSRGPYYRVQFFHGHGVCLSCSRCQPVVLYCSFVSSVLSLTALRLWRLRHAGQVSEQNYNEIMQRCPEAALKTGEVLSSA